MVKTVLVLNILSKLWYSVSLMNRKFKRTAFFWNSNLL